MLQCPKDLSRVEKSFKGERPLTTQNPLCSRKIETKLKKQNHENKIMRKFQHPTLIREPELCLLPFLANSVCNAASYTWLLDTCNENTGTEKSSAPCLTVSNLKDGWEAFSRRPAQILSSIIQSSPSFLCSYWTIICTQLTRHMELHTWLMLIIAHGSSHHCLGHHIQQC